MGCLLENKLKQYISPTEQSSSYSISSAMQSSMSILLIFSLTRTTFNHLLLSDFIMYDWDKKKLSPVHEIYN